jgi:hypothetical protein
LPGYLDAQQKGRSLNLERDSERREQGSDRGHSERKNQLPLKHLVLTSSAASNYPLVLSQALFTKRRGLTNKPVSLSSMSAVKQQSEQDQAVDDKCKAARLNPAGDCVSMEKLHLVSVA